MQDNGGTANGGVDLDQSANTITVNVKPVNDKPTAAASPASLTFNEDGAAQTVALSGADQETGAADLTFTITHAPTRGTLKHGATPLATGDTFTNSPQDVTFTPAANDNGSDNFKFTVTDRGDRRQLHPGRHLLRRQARLDRADRPDHDHLGQRRPRRRGQDRHHQRGHQLHAAAADFGFSDSNDRPPNTLQAVKITTLPGAGTLKNNGVDVVVGQEISATDIADGKLKFAPAANANGNNYAHFDFQVPRQRRHRQLRRQPRSQREHDHRQRHRGQRRPRRH